MDKSGKRVLAIGFAMAGGVILSNNIQPIVALADIAVATTIIFVSRGRLALMMERRRNRREVPPGTFH